MTLSALLGAGAVSAVHIPDPGLARMKGMTQTFHAQEKDGIVGTLTGLDSAGIENSSCHKFSNSSNMASALSFSERDRFRIAVT